MKLNDKIELFLEDNMVGMARYPDKYFDLAIVDPPYGILIENSGTMFKKFGNTKGWDDETPNKEYWQELFRVSKDQIVWGGNYFIEYLKNTKCIIWWDKMNGTNMMADGEMAWTSFNTHSQRFQMHHFSKGYAEKIHPTQKPVALYKWLLEKYAQPHFKIIDTHAGSFSHGIAAHKFGCQLTGFEIDPEYHAAAVHRFQMETNPEYAIAHKVKTTGQTDLFLTEKAA